MKKMMKLLVLALILGMISGCAKETVKVLEDSQANGDFALKGKPNKGCTSIQDGTLKTSDGSIIKVGFDEWGYN